MGKIKTMDEVVKKNRSTDIILVLKAIDGQPLNTLGVVDKRLFTGENRLHAVMDPQTTFWYLKYDHGVIPEAFKQKFTKLDLLMKFVRQYFKTRNVEVADVID